MGGEVECVFPVRLYLVKVLYCVNGGEGKGRGGARLTSGDGMIR